MKMIIGTGFVAKQFIDSVSNAKTDAVKFRHIVLIHCIP